MSDTRIERSICQAIQIIADKKISQASFDKTVKAVIKSCLDKTTGKYEIKYQDSIFQAYATNSEISYNNGEEVFILIPGNDWNRTKTIINGVNVAATMYKEIPFAGELYNTVGGNLVKGSANLCSYKDQFRTLYEINGENNLIEVDQQSAKKYIKQGNGLAIGMVVQTKLAASQVGGDYGLVFNLHFRDAQGGAAVRPYLVNSTDVIGNPYSLITPTLVERFIESVDTENFEYIQSIQIYCNGFPQNENIHIDDIFITDIKLNGATALTQEQLSGYSLHIDYSQDGNVLSSNKSIITLEAQLKSGGKIIKDKVDYYWFRQNGLIFRNSAKYSGFAGDGWECLNYYSGTSPVAAGDTFNFTSLSQNQNATTCLAMEKNTKVRCVAVYNKRERISGDVNVFNQLITNNIQIVSSDLIEGQNKTIYYLGAGRPTLTCNAKDKNGEQLTNINQTWSITPARGQAEQKPNTIDLNNTYNSAKTTWENTERYVQSLAAADQEDYTSKEEYLIIKQNWEDIKDVQRIDNNIYYNFPINTITNYSKISCAIEQEDGIYLGTASIILYNKPQTEGTYTLNIENGTQVFQYDGKGNSPVSGQLEKPLEILPLTFTLLDNTGTQISYEQIINNGEVRWLIPGTNTLLSSVNNGDPDVEYGSTIATGADLAFAADYDIYKNHQSFNYTIDDTYDSKKTNNHIRLNIVYKDMVLDAYTDFTFPKDGDPGTNGTDYVAKISPQNNTDRIYISNKAISSPFDDSGNAVDGLNFLLYNNSKKIEDIDSNYIIWTCPPGNKVGNTYLSTVADGRPRAKVNSATAISQALTNIRSDKPIDIVRASYLNGQIQQYAEYPICYNYVIGNYRIKVKPKTGFKYAVYQEDGTAPEYDNTLPFEIVVEKMEDSTGYYYTGLANLSYNWYTIGNIELDNNRNTGLKNNQKYFKPKNTFDGSNLTSAIVVKVAQNGNDIGLIHIPVYMIINRYNHQALNGWDGNSIDLGNTNGDTILAPQIGAGKKQTDNSFTGVFMGDVKGTLGTEDIGLMGYHHGQRSIFLDAQTGKAQFGKQGKSQIVLDPTSDKAQLYSGNYYPTTNKTGMLIDLTTPEIKFGSGNFSVNSAGQLTAKGGGSVAGWKISDDTLTSDNNKVYLQSKNYTTDKPYAIYSNGTFSVTPDGFLISTSGKIAKWSIDANALTDGNVGMGEGKIIAPNTFDNQSSSISNARIWSGNNTTTTFVVTADGKLYSKDGQIASWSIGQTNLTNGNVGLGSKNIDKSRFSTSNNLTARIWSGSNGSQNFAVTNDGALYSRSGKIGGWTISDTKLSANNININSNGTIQSNNYSGTSTGYSINGDGTAVFNQITANGGTIGGWTIGTSQLKGGSVILNKAGSLTGPNWSIDEYGNATFNRVQGVIASSGGSASLTNSNGTFKVDSDGDCRFGTGEKALTYDSGSGVLSLGNWEIEGNFIQNKTGNTKIHATQVITGGFSCVSSGGTQNPGVSGTITFSDGSRLTIMGGIITGVRKGEGAEWD